MLMIQILGTMEEAESMGLLSCKARAVVIQALLDIGDGREEAVANFERLVVEGVTSTSLSSDTDRSVIGRLYSVMIASPLAAEARLRWLMKALALRVPLSRKALTAAGSLVNQVTSTQPPGSSTPLVSELALGKYMSQQ